MPAKTASADGLAVTVERNAILPALARLARVVERRTTIPILANLRLEAGETGLSLTATDLDIAVTIAIAADLRRPGAITVPAQTLHDITRKLPDGAPVSLESAAERVTLRAGRSRFSLPALPAADFPELVTGEFPHRLRLTGRALARILGRVEFAISTEETRYYLNGVFFHAHQTATGLVLRAVATDGHRLAHVEAAAVEGLEPSLPPIIVPRKTVAELARLAEAAGDDPLTIEIAPAKIRASAASTVLTSKLIDGTFPDYQRVIPTGNDKRLTADTAALAAAVDRVATLASERGRAIKLALDAGHLTLSARDPDAGEASEELDVGYDAPAIEIAFNGRYLAELLKAAGGETVLVRLADAGSPTLFVPHEGGDTLYVLMPMRA